MISLFLGSLAAYGDVSEEFERISDIELTSLSAAYLILDLDPYASDDEVRNAHIRLMRKCAPRTIEASSDPRYSRVAQKINDARAVILEEREMQMPQFQSLDTETPHEEPQNLYLVNLILERYEPDKRIWLSSELDDLAELYLQLHRSDLKVLLGEVSNYHFAHPFWIARHMIETFSVEEIHKCWKSLKLIWDQYQVWQIRHPYSYRRFSWEQPMTLQFVLQQKLDTLGFLPSRHFRGDQTSEWRRAHWQDKAKQMKNLVEIHRLKGDRESVISLQKIRLRSLVLSRRHAPYREIAQLAQEKLREVLEFNSYDLPVWHSAVESCAALLTSYYNESADRYWGRNKGKHMIFDAFKKPWPGERGSM